MLTTKGKGLVFLLILFVFVGCNSKKKKYKKVFNSLEIQETRNRTLKTSQATIGIEAYWVIYNQMVDSLNLWVENKLLSYEFLPRTGDYEIDSIVCVNKSGDKLWGNLYIRCLIEGCSQDYVSFIYGVKIKDNWFFFSGPMLVLPREFYQADTQTPLLFETIKQIATKEIYEGYLIKVENKWEINDFFFTDFTSVAWCSNCSTQLQWDSAYMNAINRNWASKKGAVN